MKSKRRGMSRLNSVLVFVMTLFLSSCHSNVIGFDPNSFTVYTVDNYPIIRLHVYMENAKMSFHISKVEKVNGSTSVKLDSLGNYYRIVADGNIYQAPKEYKNIPIVASETYEILHSSIGDATAYRLYFVTDGRGRVNKVYRKQGEEGPEIILMEVDK